MPRILGGRGLARMVLSIVLEPLQKQPKTARTRYEDSDGEKEAKNRTLRKKRRERNRERHLGLDGIS